MGNRWLNQFHKAFQKETLTIYAQVSFGNTGAPTLITANSASLGVKSVTRVSAGKFQFTFQDPWSRYFGIAWNFDVSFMAGGSVPASPFVFVQDSSSFSNATPTLTINTANASGASGALVIADPANLERLNIAFEFGNSVAV